MTTVLDARFSPDSKLIASISNGGTAVISNTDGEKMTTLVLDNTGGQCCSIIFSPDGANVIIGCETGIQVWTIGNPVSYLSLTLEAYRGVVHDLSITPDGKTLVATENDPIHDKCEYVVWDLTIPAPTQPCPSTASPQCADTFSKPSASKTGTVSPDGKLYVQAQQNRTVSLQHVYRKHNKLADQLARQAALESAAAQRRGSAPEAPV
eukprot:TRINITY_DN7911_c0_g1_i4.p2 TRINITY_DN7911_c0_g1~~TRINITY_DN7911_c0_g1_i4.p2  ORF type:complete len:208 (+),score=8.68 TRINITY_DN7911_c0_g1_i4:670-1293(+)